MQRLQQQSPEPDLLAGSQIPRLQPLIHLIKLLGIHGKTVPLNTSPRLDILAGHLLLGSVDLIGVTSTELADRLKRSSIPLR